MKSSIITEEWRYIPQFEGYYKMSNLGKIESVDRVVSYTNNTQHLHKGHIITQKEEGNGYFRVGLCKNGKVKYYSVHRLLAITFPELIDYTEDAIGLPIEELEINHKNECKWDNVYWNLEWCTHKYNNEYGTRVDRMVDNLSKPVEQYTKDGQFVAEYKNCNDAQKQTGIYKSQINYCCLQKPHYKTAGGYIWKYKN